MNEMAETIERNEQRTGQCLVCEDATATLGYENQTFNYGPAANGILLSARVPVWTCEGCGEQYLDDEAEVIKHEAVCAHLERLTPAEIRNLRASFGMLQEAFAAFTGYGSASIKRWETGAQIQSESVDKHLRLLRSLGLAEVTRRAAQPPAPIFRTQISASARDHSRRFNLRVSAPPPEAMAA
jgi:putative zinc finger/helix-turn-helix YgiT family protein